MYGLVVLPCLSRTDEAGAISAMSRIHVDGVGALSVISGLKEGFPNMLCTINQLNKYPPPPRGLPYVLYLV